MARLARRQERELRAWLYGIADVGEPSHLHAAVEAMAVEVETDHDVRVEAVVVGDQPLDDDLASLVAALREASSTPPSTPASSRSTSSSRPTDTELVGVRPRHRSRVRPQRACPPTGAASASRSSAASHALGGDGTRSSRGRVRHRGRAARAARPAMSVARRAGRRPRPVPRRRARRARRAVRAETSARRGSRSSAKRPTSTTAIAVIRRHDPDVVVARRAPAGWRRPGGHRRRARRSLDRRGSWRCRCPTRPRTSSPSSAPARADTSPRRSTPTRWSTRSRACTTATRCSRRGWPGSCSTRSPATCPPPATPSSIS